MSGIGGWNLPFEEQTVTLLAGSDQIPVAQAVVVMAAVAPTPLGMLPVLVFRFEVPGCKDMPTVVLMMDTESLRGIPPLIEAAVAAAIRKAAAHRDGGR